MALCNNIFFQNRALLFVLKTCSVRYLSSSIIFLMVSGNSFAAYGLAEVAPPVILTFLKPNLILKSSSHQSSPPLDPSSSFKLYYNDFDFLNIRVYKYAFLYQSFPHIKATVSIWHKNIFHTESRFSCLLVKLQWQLHELTFLFLTMVLTLDSFILKWWASTAANLNLCYISSNSTSSCKSWLCPASWEYFQQH